MKWEKLGKISEPKGQHPWMLTHAANPAAVPLQGDRVRVYFSSRDKDNRAHIGFVEIDIKRPDQILALSDEPVVAPGSPGHFDDSGTSLACITTVKGRRFLYYLGWNLGVTVPWRNSIGLAIEDPATGRFVKHTEAPIMDRDATDPFSISYPYVLEDGGIFRMWYGSNLAWGSKQEDMAHVLKYAESKDGIHWSRTGKVAIPLQHPGEYALSRPCVRKENGLYRMWYSYRGQAYRIGYAESPDGIVWKRLDDRVGISPSPDGWDSESLEYVNLFDHGGETYMLYNGNRYGLTGVGLARLAR